MSLIVSNRSPLMSVCDIYKCSLFPVAEPPFIIHEMMQVLACILIRNMIFSHGA